MTHKDIYDMLASTNIPVTYRFWKIGHVPSLPYIVYYYPNHDDFIADNSNYQAIAALNVELYTKNKDFATEEAVESILNEYGLVYDKTETYLETENMFEILYESEVIINGEQS